MSVYMEEIFDGLKPKHLAKLYHFAFTLRRLIIVAIVIFMEHILTSVRLFTFIMFQFCAFLYVIYVRPFDNIKDNLIEIVNDSVYVILSIMMMFLDQINFKSSILMMPMVYLVMLNGAIVILITYTSIVIDIIKKLKRKKKVNKTHVKMGRAQTLRDPKNVVVDCSDYFQNSKDTLQNSNKQVPIYFQDTPSNENYKRPTRKAGNFESSMTVAYGSNMLDSSRQIRPESVNIYRHRVHT